MMPGQPVYQKSFKTPFIISTVIAAILFVIIIIEAVIVIKNKTKQTYECPCKKAAEEVNKPPESYRIKTFTP